MKDFVRCHAEAAPDDHVGPPFGVRIQTCRLKHDFGSRRGMRALALSLVVACGGSPPAKAPVPPKDDVLAIVIEGECERLRASVLENVVLIHWYGHVARWTGSG